MTAARNAARAVSGRLTVGLQAAAGGSVRTRALAAFERAYPEVALGLVSYDLAQPAAGLIEGGSDVALLRPPVDAAGILLEQVCAEPRVFVLPAGHPLASRPVLELADVAGLPWVAAPLSVDGCAPARWRDDWLMVPRPGRRRVTGHPVHRGSGWRGWPTVIADGVTVGGCDGCGPPLSRLP